MENIVNTIVPGAEINLGYFDDDNITFIQQKVCEILGKEYIQEIYMSRADIIRVMLRELELRRENVPKMNQRVIMDLCSDFRRHQQDVCKHLNWERGYIYSQRLIDEYGQISRYDDRAIKTKDRKKYDNREKTGGTLRFYFT